MSVSFILPATSLSSRYTPTYTCKSKRRTVSNSIVPLLTPDQTVLKYVDAAQPFSKDQPPLITTTVQEYDTNQLKSNVKAALMGVGMMGVMHLQFGYAQPLIVQSIMPIKNVFESKVAKVHLLGQEAVGDLKRPWKVGGLFAGASDVISPQISYRKSKSN